MNIADHNLIKEIATPDHQHHGVPDLRDEIFQQIRHHRVTAALVADAEGMVTGIPDLLKTFGELEIELQESITNNSSVKPGDRIALFYGSPKQIAKAEERSIGMLSKTSGIATRARQFVDAAAGRVRIVSGAWKKMPMQLKHPIRHAVAAGGADFRICRHNFLYLDKNFVRMLGGISQTLEATRHIKGHKPVIQIKGETAAIEQEALQAARHGAGVIFIDTGLPHHIEQVSETLKHHGLRQQVSLAYAGNITLDAIESLCALDVDRLDIGKAIVDAPLLDIKLDVLGIQKGVTS